MNCLECRRAFGADPNHASAATLAHRADCPACEQYAQEMLHLNGVIKRALEIPVPLQKAANAPRLQPRRLAMAASAILAIGLVVGILSLSTPRESLASAVVKHLAHEPDAINPTQARIATAILDAALRAKGLHLTHAMNDVSYLESCVIRRHFVPHLVVQTDRGPVTVLLLTEEKVAANEYFDEQQYHGMLVPMPRGAMAVIATDRSVVDAVAERMRASVSE